MGIAERIANMIDKVVESGSDSTRLLPNQRIILKRDYKQDVRPRSRDDDAGDPRISQSESRRKILCDLVTVDMDRKRRIQTYEEMDKSDIASASVDMYAEDATLPNPENGRTVWIESDSPAIRDAGEEVLENLEAEEEVLSLARNTALYGETFERLIYEPFLGVRAFFHTPASEIKRHEDRFRILMGYSHDGLKIVRDNINGRKLSEPWDFIHFRIRGRFRNSPYGVSVLHNAIRAWRQMCVVEGTKVWTTNGPVPIENLIPGRDVVYCHDPEKKETHESHLAAVLDMGEQPLVRIKTRHREIVVTPNHGMLVRDKDKNFSYKRADEIICSDGKGGTHSNNADQLVLPAITYGKETHTIEVNPDNYSVWLSEKAEYEPEGIVVALADAGLRTSPKNAHAFLCGKRAICCEDFLTLASHARYKLPEYSIHWRGSRSLTPAPYDGNLTFKADAKFARLFGFMLGVGWLVAKNNIVGIALGVNDSLNEKYIALFKELFGGVPHHTVAGEVGIKGAQEIFYSAALVDLFESAGFITGFDKKVVPEWVFGMSPVFKTELIMGLLDADGGHVPESAGWRLSLSNENLMASVYTLAQQAGFRTGSHVVEINREGRATAYRIWLAAPVDDPKAVVYENVTHVSDAGFGRTFDLTVEDDLHNFIADGVVSHNTLGEDQALMYRLMRAPDRFAFFVDTGTQGEVDAWRSLQRFRRRHKKLEFVDPASGRYDHRFNPITPVEDIYLAVNGKDSGTKVEKLFGSNNQNDVTDLVYYIRKFCAAVRIPPEFLGFNYPDQKTASTFEPKSGLANQSRRYANSIAKLQRAIKEGFRHALEIHLRLKTNDPEDATYDFTRPENKFRVMMLPPSQLDEMDRIDADHIRSALADALLKLGIENEYFDLYNWTVHVLKKVFRLGDNEITKLISKTPRPDANANFKPLAGVEAKAFDAAVRNVIAEMRKAELEEALEDSSRSLRHYDVADDGDSLVSVLPRNLVSRIKANPLLITPSTTHGGNGKKG